MSFELFEHELPNSSAPSVLIIDDEFTSRMILEKIVKNIHRDITVSAFADPVAALAWVRNNQPDLILLDYLMENMSGLEVVTRIRKLPHLEGVPIVMITVAEGKSVRYQVLDAGATDFISKPIDPYECRVRCRNLLSMRLHEKIVLHRAHSLEQTVADATRQIRDREQETLFRLAKAGEFRDSDTGNHVLRMAKYSRLIAEGLGMTQERCELIEIAAPMHDIGKIGIPDNILLKPAKLTSEETAIMQNHPMIGYKMLHNSRSEFIALAAEISLGHHEKYDGNGYPNRLAGKDIPLESRIVAVADVYDALTSVRPYKHEWSKEQALEYLIANKGQHFDPDCIESFVSQFNKITLIQQQLKDFAFAPSAQVIQ
jgi:two-component system response regulator RpfG